MSEPALPTVPDETDLSRQVPERPNWADILAALNGITGKDLVEAGSLGEKEAQNIADLDTRVKNYMPKFAEWYWASPFGQVEKAGKQFAEMIRFAEERRGVEVRKRCAHILGERQTIIDARVAQEQRRLEAERLERERLEREAELAALKAQQEVAPAEQKEELAQVMEERKAAPLTPAAVGKQEVLATMTGAAKPKGLTGTPVCRRTVTDAQAHFAFLGSDKGKHLISVMYRFTVDDKGNCIIAGSTAPLKRDLETAYPGLSNFRGTETQNRGK